MEQQMTNTAERESLQPAGGHAPGEPALWVLLIGDMVMFGWMFAVFVAYKHWTPEQVAVFKHGHATLNPYFGLANTALLLISSWFLALAVRAAKNGLQAEGSKHIRAAMACGAAFVVLKIFEYGEHISNGYLLNTDIFHNFYYTYTWIHLMHVLVGLGVLGYLSKHCFSGDDEKHPNRIAILEGGSCYWHMVDVFWIIIFSLFYLAV